MPVADGLFMQEQLWLLLPEELQAPAAAKATLRVIQCRAFRAAARGAGALLGLEGRWRKEWVLARGMLRHTARGSERALPATAGSLELCRLCIVLKSKAASAVEVLQPGFC